VPNPLKLILRRWDLIPPNLFADEFNDSLSPYITHPEISQLIERRADLSHVDCHSCGNGNFCEVHFIESDDGSSVPCAYCSHCGPFEVDPINLQCWQICTVPALNYLFGKMEVQTEVERIIGESLWSIGKARWSGGTRTILFAVGTLQSEAIEHLNRYRQALLFVSSQRLHQKVEQQISNTVFDLESILLFENDQISFDLGEVEDALVERDRHKKQTADKKTKRNDSIGKKVERLKTALTKLLVDARDYHLSTKYTGTAKMLQRPTQKDLANITKLSESDVSRYLKDEKNVELRTLWETLGDPEAILRYSGNIRCHETEV
tara:strand:- start:33 stop:992 length:960 start_codon:yes stop_codon:yes gene_type:complete